MADHTISDSDFRLFLRLQDLASKYDGVDGLGKKIDKLEADAKDYREKIKTLEGRATEVPEGAVMLTGDDATKWTKVRDVDVDDLTKKATEGEEAKTKLAGFKWEKVARRMAADDNLRFNADALVVLPGIRGFTFESREVTEGDKKVTRWTAKDAKGQAVEVSKDWITGNEEWKPLATSVFAQAETNGKQQQNGGGYTATPERPAGGGDKKAGAGVDALLEANQKAAQGPNALRPAKTT
jgi:hypothetical protein